MKQQDLWEKYLFSLCKFTLMVNKTTLNRFKIKTKRTLVVVKMVYKSPTQCHNVFFLNIYINLKSLSNLKINQTCHF